MPYSGPADKSLPDAVQKLPRWLRKKWVAVFDDTFAESDDEGDAMRSAWGAVRQADDEKKKAEKAARSADMARKQAEQAEQSDIAAETTDEAPIAAMAEPGTADVATEEKSLDLDETRIAISRAFKEVFGKNEDIWLESIRDDHVVADTSSGMFKVAIVDVVVKTAEDGVTEVVDAVTFAPRSEWVPVVRTYTAVKLFEEPNGRYRWLAVSSGGFVDRDGEIVSTAFLEDAVARADKANDRGELWVYHVPGTRVGECDYQAVSDGFLLESGLMDETPAAEKAMAYLQEHPDAEMSIQFAYRNRTSDGVYSPPGFIIERSILPAQAAAFPWSGITFTEIPTMATLSDAKKKALEDILGADITAEVLDGLETNAAVLKEAGVRYKELSDAAAVDEVTDAGSATDNENDEPLQMTLSAETLESETEIIFSDEALDDIAAKLWQRVEGLVEKSINPIGDQVGQLRTVVEAMGADMARFAESEDQRIAEKAADLPRMTVRRIVRPTQRKELNEPEQPGEAESLLNVGTRTLYG